MKIHKEKKKKRRGDNKNKGVKIKNLLKKTQLM